MKRMIYVVVIASALLLTVSAFNRTDTKTSTKASTTCTQVDNTCCGGCVEERCR